MANKPTARNWNDIQIVIATISMALTLGLWNLFAGPDRETALKRAQEQAQAQPTQPMVQSPSAVIVQPGPTPLGDGVLLLGGSAPQTTVIVQGGGNGGGNNNNASGGGTGGS
jgi:hypothetical protein